MDTTRRQAPTISDVLHEAIADIEEDLRAGILYDPSDPEIHAVLKAMRELQHRLDSFPDERVTHEQWGTG